MLMHGLHPFGISLDPCLANFCKLELVLKPAGLEKLQVTFRFGGAQIQAGHPGPCQYLACMSHGWALSQRPLLAALQQAQHLVCLLPQGGGWLSELPVNVSLYQLLRLWLPQCLPERILAVRMQPQLLCQSFDRWSRAL